MYTGSFVPSLYFHSDLKVGMGIEIEYETSPQV